MTNVALASYSTLSIYSAMAVLTLAMLAFAIDLARSAPRAAAAPLAAEPVPAAGASRPPAPASFDRPDPPLDRPDPPVAARPAAGVGMALSWLAGALVLLGVVLRGLSVMRVPWGNMYEFATTGCAAVLAAFLVWSLRRDLRWLGLFIIGPVLLTLGLAVAVFYTEAAQLLPSLKSFWLVIHVIFAIVAVALFTVAFSVTIVQLVKSHRETHPPATATFMEGLPSAAALDRTAYGLHIVAFPLWTFTLIAGAIWAEQAWGAYWQWDPKEVWTFVIWIVYAAYLHARATAGWSTRSVNYLALAGYGCILINYLVVNIYFVGMHSYSGM
ncbi:c-type cytochrome biogenesis protein CcsB [Segeticoccus rhizosphaerae]|uniref:c-type cytochrome biogenesis protein CcsB n=1 Tax=Segeticoccus rhizosphaerae TaxID=1104777 RepID=UPI0010C10FE1|nr:c-type cytochrome biogenesis protein CcsB [Ornithinicoccus soli]